MTKITAGSAFQWIEDAFKDYKRPDRASGRGFDLLVIVDGRVDGYGPRHPRYEFIIDMGMPLIEKVLNRKPIGVGPHFFIFPDRWMVPGESQRFTDDLNNNPDAKKFARVYVVTHQPYIVSGCLKEEVRVISGVK